MLRQRGLAWWRAHGLALLGFGVILTVVGAFYRGGGLLAPQQVATGMTVVGNLVGAVAVALPCAGLGHQILSWVGVPVQTGGERALVAFPLGTGALGLITLTLGMIGWLTWGAAVVVLSVAAVVSLRGSMRAWCLDVVEGCRALGGKDQGSRLAFGVTVLADPMCHFYSREFWLPGPIARGILNPAG